MVLAHQRRKEVPDSAKILTRSRKWLSAIEFDYYCNNALLDQFGWCLYYYSLNYHLSYWWSPGLIEGRIQFRFQFLPNIQSSGLIIIFPTKLFGCLFFSESGGWLLSIKSFNYRQNFSSISAVKFINLTKNNFKPLIIKNFP